jgi:hypothetical protein
MMKQGGKRFDNERLKVGTVTGKAEKADGERVGKNRQPKPAD